MPTEHDRRDRRRAEERLGTEYPYPDVRRRRASRRAPLIFGAALVLVGVALIVLGVEWPPAGWYGPEYPRALTPILLILVGAVLLVSIELDR